MAAGNHTEKSVAKPTTHEAEPTDKEKAKAPDDSEHSVLWTNHVAVLLPKIKSNGKANNELTGHPGVSLNKTKASSTNASRLNLSIFSAIRVKSHAK